MFTIQRREDEMGGQSSTHGRDGNVYRILVGRPVLNMVTDLWVS
jgi:hypothetical protein